MEVDDETFSFFESRYMLRRKLGDGGTADVFIIEERTLSGDGRQFACKRVRRRPDKSWSRATRTFQRELNLLRHCAHPHIVEVVALHRSPKDLALILQLVPGGDLQQLLERHGALWDSNVWSVARQMHAALQHLHGLTVLHRDVKLENVLVNAASAGQVSVKLCDFGHSCFAADANDGFRGTEGYSPPEVCARSPPLWTAAADVWSTGVVIYALLSNTPLRCLADGTADLSLKAFRKVSATSTLLLHRLLMPDPAERVSLARVGAILDEGAPSLESVTPTGFGTLASSPSAPHTAGGDAASAAPAEARDASSTTLRRGLGNVGHSYSQLDMASMALVEAGGAVRRAPLQHAYSRSSSLASLDSAATDGGLGGGVAVAAEGAGVGVGMSAGTLTPGRSLPSMSASQPATPSNSHLGSHSPPGLWDAREDSLHFDATFQVTKHGCSWLGGRRYERLLTIGERGARTFDPVTRRETNDWRWPSVLAVTVDDDPSDARGAPAAKHHRNSSASRRLHWPEHERGDERQRRPLLPPSRPHTFSLLLDIVPSWLGCGSFLTRATFSVPHRAQLNEIVLAIRSYLTHSLTPPQEAHTTYVQPTTAALALAAIGSSTAASAELTLQGQPRQLSPQRLSVQSSRSPSRSPPREANGAKPAQAITSPKRTLVVGGGGANGALGGGGLGMRHASSCGTLQLLESGHAASTIPRELLQPAKPTLRPEAAARLERMRERAAALRPAVIEG